MLAAEPPPWPSASEDPGYDAFPQPDEHHLHLDHSSSSDDPAPELLRTPYDSRSQSGGGRNIPPLLDEHFPREPSEDDITEKDLLDEVDDDDDDDALIGGEVGDPYDDLVATINQKSAAPPQFRRSTTSSPTKAAPPPLVERRTPSPLLVHAQQQIRRLSAGKC